MDLPWLSRWQPYLLALLRIVTALLFLEHATQKFFAFPVPFPVQPLPPVLVAAGVIELVAGILVTIGLFTRLAAFIASGEMAVAYFKVHIHRSFFPINNRGDNVVLFCFVMLFLAFAGGGVWAIDYWLARCRRGIEARSPALEPSTSPRPAAAIVRAME